MSASSEHRTTGINWIPSLPKHWALLPLKYGIGGLESGVSVNAADISAGPDELGVLKTSCVYSGSFRPGENKTVVPEDHHRVKCPVRKGAIVISRMNTPNLVGASALVNNDHPHLFLPDRLWQTVQPQNGLLAPSFLAYFLGNPGFRQQVSLAAEGASSSMQSVSRSSFLSLPVPVPPINEQAQIARFLDHETAKIDRLIEKQQQLIALLKEKRQAVISHAVTKGLNPDVPMKDSGVEWLGEVPAHWGVSQLGHLTREVTVGIVVTPASYYVDEGIPCLRSLNVRPGYLRADELVHISPRSNDLLGKSKIFSGDVVIVRTGQPGTAAKISETFNGCNCIDLIIVRRSSRLDSDFLVYLLNSESAGSQVRAGSGGAIQQHFNVGLAMKLRILVPPLAEQVQIVENLDCKVAKLDGLIEAAEIQTDLLQERRTALISAAVTGKIDVRNWQPTEVEQAEVEPA